MTKTSTDLVDILEKLVTLGRTRAAMFEAHELWLKAGKPAGGPVATRWYAAHSAYINSLATITREADALFEKENQHVT